jgi:DNA-binding CsgD family transcriptional regulator
MSAQYGPYSPELHGRFMTECYEQSLSLGQLAVSYVLTHYQKGMGGFDKPPRQLRQSQLDVLMRLSTGTRPEEEAALRDVKLSSVQQSRRRLYTALNLHGKEAAVRLGIETGLIPFDRDLECNAPDISPYELVVYDLATRGLVSGQVGRLTGDTADYVRSTRIPRVLQALGVPQERKTYAVVRMYEWGLFHKGLGLLNSLDAYPEDVAKFDEFFGRNQPFRNTPGAPRYWKWEKTT